MTEEDVTPGTLWGLLRAFGVQGGLGHVTSCSTGSRELVFGEARDWVDSSSKSSMSFSESSQMPEISRSATAVLRRVGNRKAVLASLSIMVALSQNSSSTLNP